MRVPILACLLLVLAAGCLQQPTPNRYSPACSTDGPLMWGAFDGRTSTRWTQDGDPETDPRQPWKTVLAMRGDASFGLAVEAGNATLQWFGNGTEHLAMVALDPPAKPVGFTVTADGVDCVRFPTPSWPSFAAPREGAVAEVGKGVLVYTAGFLENGTLFYTNMPEVHEGPDADGKAWPRTSWYAWEGDAPLQVYVYDKDRSEEPPQWSAGGNVPPMPAEDAAVPARYFTTIRGFNEALKGLSTSTLTAVHIAPEDAYTRAGNEKHPLYGQALIFIIRVEAVADYPCPLARLNPDFTPQDPCYRR